MAFHKATYHSKLYLKCRKPHLLCTPQKISIPLSDRGTAEGCGILKPGSMPLSNQSVKFFWAHKKWRHPKAVRSALYHLYFNVHKYNFIYC
jgi:hypothetical protein